MRSSWRLSLFQEEMFSMNLVTSMMVMVTMMMTMTMMIAIIIITIIGIIFHGDSG